MQQRRDRGGKEHGVEPPVGGKINGLCEQGFEISKGDAREGLHADQDGNEASTEGEEEKDSDDCIDHAPQDWSAVTPAFGQGERYAVADIIEERVEQGGDSEEEEYAGRTLNLVCFDVAPRNEEQS